MPRVIWGEVRQWTHEELRELPWHCDAVEGVLSRPLRAACDFTEPSTATLQLARALSAIPELAGLIADWQRVHSRGKDAQDRPSLSSDAYLTTSSAAKLAGVHEKTIRRWIKRGLVAHKVGRAFRIRTGDLVQFIENEAGERKARFDADQIASDVLKRVEQGEVG